MITSAGSGCSRKQREERKREKVREREKALRIISLFAVVRKTKHDNIDTGYFTKVKAQNNLMTIAVMPDDLEESNILSVLND